MLHLLCLWLIIVLKFTNVKVTSHYSKVIKAVSSTAHIKYCVELYGVFTKSVYRQFMAGVMMLLVKYSLDAKVGELYKNVFCVSLYCMIIGVYNRCNIRGVISVPLYCLVVSCKMLLLVPRGLKT